MVVTVRQLLSGYCSGFSEKALAEFCAEDQRILLREDLCHLGVVQGYLAKHKLPCEALGVSEKTLCEMKNRLQTALTALDSAAS